MILLSRNMKCKKKELKNDWHNNGELFQSQFRIHDIKRFLFNIYFLVIWCIQHRKLFFPVKQRIKHNFERNGINQKSISRSLHILQICLFHLPSVERFPKRKKVMWKQSFTFIVVWTLQRSFKWNASEKCTCSDAYVNCYCE